MRIDNQLLELSQAMKFGDFIAPKNDSIEKDAFLKAYRKGTEYNPQYKYAKLRVDLENIKQKITRLKTSNEIYDGVKDFLLKKIDFLQNKNDEVIYIHDVPKKDLVEKAKSLISTKKATKQTRNIPAKHVKVIFNDHLRSVSLNGWKVVISKNSFANASVNSSDKKVTLKLRNYSFKEVRTLIDHEVGAHVFRAANGYLQKYKILGTIGTGNYLKTEEGIATVMEDLAGDHNPTRFRFFCAREIATNMAIKHSFYNIFKVLHEKYNLSQNNSYAITKRVKRGMCDTSLPGGFIKDHVYFEGRDMIINYMKQGGSLVDLYSGRYGIEDLQLLKDLKPPKYMPMLLRNLRFELTKK